jgi:hypothetical protein
MVSYAPISTLKTLAAVGYERSWFQRVGNQDTSSVANRPKFLPQNTKVAGKKYEAEENGG